MLPCVDVVNLLDPNVVGVFEADGMVLSEETTGFGDSRDFGLDLGGANGILKILSSSLGMDTGALFNRASKRASGL